MEWSIRSAPSWSQTSADMASSLRSRQRQRRWHQLRNWNSMKTAGEMGCCLETWSVSALSPLHQESQEEYAKASPPFCLLKAVKMDVSICTANMGIQVFFPAHVPCPRPHPFPKAAGIREPGLGAALHYSPQSKVSFNPCSWSRETEPDIVHMGKTSL